MHSNAVSKACLVPVVVFMVLDLVWFSLLCLPAFSATCTVMQSAKKAGLQTHLLHSSPQMSLQTSVLCWLHYCQWQTGTRHALLTVLLCMPSGCGQVPSANRLDCCRISIELIFITIESILCRIESILETHTTQFSGLTILKQRLAICMCMLCVCML